MHEINESGPPYHDKLQIAGVRMPFGTGRSNNTGIENTVIQNRRSSAYPTKRPICHVLETLYPQCARGVPAIQKALLDRIQGHRLAYRVFRRVVDGVLKTVLVGG